MWWWLQTTTCVEENIKAETGHHFKRQHPARAFPVAELVKRTASRKKQCAILLSRRSVHKKRDENKKMINTLPKKVTKRIKRISKLYRLTAPWWVTVHGTRHTWYLLPYLMYAQGASRTGFLKNEILKCALDDFAAEIAKFIEFLLCRRFRVCVCVPAQV